MLSSGRLSSDLLVSVPKPVTLHYTQQTTRHPCKRFLVEMTRSIASRASTLRALVPTPVLVELCSIPIASPGTDSLSLPNVSALLTLLSRLALLLFLLSVVVKAVLLPLGA